MRRLDRTAVTSAKWQDFDMIFFLMGGSLASSLKSTARLAIEVPASSPRGIGVSGLCGDHAMSRDIIESVVFVWEAQACQTLVVISTSI